MTNSCTGANNYVLPNPDSRIYDGPSLDHRAGANGYTSRDNRLGVNSRG